MGLRNGEAASPQPRSGLSGRTDALGGGSKGPLPGPEDLRVFIGVQTAPSPANAEPFSKYDYAARRHAIRQTWMAEAARFPHMAVRFVVGRGPDGQLDPGLAAEAAEFGDFMVLDVQDCYTCLTNKSRAMFVEVARAFPGVEWVVKADDDTYILAWRLLMALDQYAAAGADYIGCLDTGTTRSHRLHRWYEPNWPQLGTNYFTRAMGSMYILSSRVVRGVIAPRQHTLRQSLSAEDSAVGMWLLGSSALFLDDLRLCSLGCSEASVGMWDPREQGLSPGAALVLHANPLCQAAVRQDAWPLPYAVRPLKPPRNPTPAQREAWEREDARQRAWAQMRK
ncbi:hypothetical protein HYH03_004766 [Edaphochlamys debaryana]|uniref:Hexosyltransferase n=1 Tax=Edaphochlamys debaryana TaxID=47281 RepID=A0A835Y6E1_9CHLO|nr:hypothetical protein HYH03_004766 [Edaphochlamys debaryana]|eukprot:KAG2497177.1 hypothetical protein HYH03_004766 [Edaphochlamys debaryana]